MKAVRYKAPGGIGNLGVVETGDPGLPGPNEILVRIHGSSLNGHDLNVAKGILPVEEGRILMSDGAGVVEAVGSGVSEFAVGDHVVSTFFQIGNEEMRRVQASLERRVTVSTAMRLKRSFGRPISSLKCHAIGISPTQQRSQPLA